jgi:hypothetical protein
MIFLDYNNPRHFQRIAADFVKSTEGTDKRATFFVSAFGKEQMKKRARKVVLLAKIIPVYVSGNIYITYITSNGTFEKLSVFKKNAEVVRQIRLVAEKIISGVKDDNCAVANKVLFEKNFSSFDAGTVLRIVSEGVDPPIYKEPIIGETTPLWCVGGNYSALCDLNKVESLFALPQISHQNTKDVVITLKGLSEIISVDNNFTTGDSKIFQQVQREDTPWNLVTSIEMGEATLNVEEKVMKSTNITRAKVGSNYVEITLAEDN